MQFLNLGIVEVMMDGVLVAIYELGKIICNFVNFINEVRFGHTKEVLKAYLVLDGRNIDKLVKYSKKLRIRTII